MQKNKKIMGLCGKPKNHINKSPSDCPECWKVKHKKDKKK